MAAEVDVFSLKIVTSSLKQYYCALLDYFDYVKLIPTSESITKTDSRSWCILDIRSTFKKLV